MTRARGGRRSTRFGRFVDSYGTARLAEKLDVTRSAVQKWLAGASSPSHELRLRLVAIGRGRITFDDIESHREEVRDAREVLA